jgi:hypothetical protein
MTTKATPVDKKLYEKIKTKLKKKFTETSRWPSAYASGILVQTYKKEFEKLYGKKTPYKSDHSKKSSNLNRWFEEKWVNVCKKKNNKYVPCGRKKSNIKKYPYCRPLVKVSSKTPMTVNEIKKKYGSNKLKAMCKKKNSKKNKKSMTFLTKLKSKKLKSKKLKSKKLKSKKKWSNAYKKSINCKNPKGFSQKQYCKSKKK